MGTSPEKLILAVLLPIAAAVAAAGCAHGSAPKNYSSGAQENYELGDKALKNEDWLDAIDYFNEVRNKYPFSKYAVLAEMGVADSYYGDEKFAEAAESYRQFAKLHPNNEHTPKAMFRIAMCSYNQMPKDWFFMPPTYEEDQTKVVETLDQMRAFLDRYPNAPEAAEGKEVVNRCLLKLAKHELYVAKFYFKGKRWKASQVRLEGLLSKYPGLGLDEESLLLLSETLVKQGKKDEAKAVLEQLVKNYPGSKEAGVAAVRLSKGF